MDLFKFFLVGILLFSNICMAQKKEVTNKEENIIYKYKKYEKFDFENFYIEGQLGAPGDLSLNPRFQKMFRNKLPYRKSFNDKIRRSVERIR
ncbi:MAG: hypothetical protein H6622_01765 [Halobacteriovoraceae bacterium]|nr:hypothetical protein [Halobacteriovoraceae bacterium]